MAEPGYIERITFVKASVAIFIVTFLTYQAAPQLFGQNWLAYQRTVQYYLLFTLAGWVMFYARTDVKIPTKGEWRPLRSIRFIPFMTGFVVWSIISIAGISIIKSLLGLPAIGNENGITLFALFDYSLIVAIHENLLWLVMIPPYLAIASWNTTAGRIVNSIPVSIIAALGHAPNIYNSLQSSGAVDMWIPMGLSVTFITLAFMAMFYVTHQYGFAAGVALHAWYNIMI